MANNDPKIFICVASRFDSDSSAFDSDILVPVRGGAVFEKDGLTYTIRNGKIVSIWKKDAAGKVVKEATDAVTKANEDNVIKEVINLITSGKQSEVGAKFNDIAVKSVRFKDVNGGTIRNFVSDGTGSTSLRNIMTNRFAINDPAVDAFRRHNEVVDNALKEISKGKIPSELQVSTATATVDGATLVFKDGKLVSINGNKAGSDLYEAYMYRNPKTPETIEALDKRVKLEHPIYALAA